MPRPLCPAALQALRSAEAFAREHGEIEQFPGTDRTLSYVTADHLLLGIAHPDTSTGIWEALGQKQDDIYEMLCLSLATGEWPPPASDTPDTHRMPPVAVEPDASASQALTFAEGEARRLGAACVGAEHLLLGALRVTEAQWKTPESLGHLTLTARGVTLHTIFTALLTSDPHKI